MYTYWEIINDRIMVMTACYLIIVNSIQGSYKHKKIKAKSEPNVYHSLAEKQQIFLHYTIINFSEPSRNT